MNTDNKELDKYINLKIRELAGHHRYNEGKSWWTGTYEELTYFAKELIQYGYDEAKLQEKLTEVHSDQLDEAAEEYAGVNYDCQDESNSFYNMVQVDAFKAGAEWQRNHDIQGRGIDIESGKILMKDELMKDAVECTVFISDGKKVINSGNIEVDADFGDRVKLIVAKE